MNTLKKLIRYILRKDEKTKREMIEALATLRDRVRAHS